ncbi:TF29 [Hepatospora eriocheir]|uniref:TF29 n=1 Tax=Hepatospora eriocheir TaxID=1081669 RepID=A0A1X0QCV8_9MICR|nr:TF29 [Hepatospora eriocheir]
MEILLNEFEFVKIFVDDILIFSENLEKHLEHIRKVCERIISKGGKINFEKSHFGLKEVNYLGMFISKSGIRADIKRIEVWKEKGITSKKKLRSFLGITNWYRKFVPLMSELTSKLNKKLVKENKEFKWEEADELDKRRILKAINENTLLKHINTKENFTLSTDASEIGISGILRQESGVVGIYSKKLSGSELNYTIPEKELYAIIKSVLHFKKIIWGRKFVIETDSKDIVTLKNKNDNRLNRWMSILGEYNYNFQHIKGNENNMADALSRGEIRLIRSGEVTNWKEKWKKGERDGKGRIIIKEEDGEEFLEELHIILLHAGETKLYNSIKTYYQVEGVKKKIEKICKECKEQKHQRNNYHTGKGILFKENCNDTVSSDIVGPFPLLKGGKKVNFYGITFIDLCSRYSKVKFMTKIRGEDVILAFDVKWISEFGKPKVLYTDQGRQYISETLRKYLEKEGIELKLNTAYNPAGNGVSEKLNQTINFCCRLYEFKNLEELEEIIEIGFNSSTCRTTGYAPSEIMKGMNLLDVEDRIIKVNMEEVKERMQTAHKFNEEEENKNKKRLIEAKVNDLVYLKNEIRGKTDALNLGPFKILEVGKMGNAVKIDYGRKTEWVNLRRVINFKEGEIAVS